jgi:hypothetical protein
LVVAALALTASAHAQLSADEIGKRLTKVPAFLCTDASGAPITLSQKEGKPLAGVFFDPAAADRYLEKVKESASELGRVKVTVVSMAEVWAQMSRPDAPVQFALIPADEAVKEARAVLKALGKPETFSGVPVFIGQVPGKGTLNATKGGVTTVPVCFRLGGIEPLVKAYNEGKDKKAPEARVEVLQLEALLTGLKTSKDKTLRTATFTADPDAVSEARRRLPPPPGR